MYGPCIVLMTDFGLTDDYTGLMEAKIATIDPKIRVLHLTHSIPPGNVEAASFLIEKDLQHLPEEAVILAVVDPGVGSDRRILAVQIEGRFILAPDNGILHPILSGLNTCEVREVQWKPLLTRNISNTFHGRDIFAPIGAKLATRELDFAAIGPLVSTWIQSEEIHPVTDDNRIIGKVMWIDQFGNLITNITESMLNHSTMIEIENILPKHVSCFSEGKPSELIWYIGSKDTVEIALNGGNAKEKLQSTFGHEVIAYTS